VQRDQLILLPDLAQRRQAGCQAERLRELDQLGVLERKRAAQRSIRRIAVWHDSGEAVESAAQQDEHETAAMLRLCEVDDRKSKGRDAAEAHGAYECAAIHGHLH
jgi:hypothetical protein